MQHTERSSVLSLGLIMAFRMLGLFMILPVFSVYAAKIPGSTAELVGLALGIYGLTQAILQIPFGMTSDIIGRKPVIFIGLLLFALGSVVAALSHSITGIILGRALQGAGAIGSTVLALLADLTRDENRSKAMAFMGLSIGSAFSVAMILGPIINAWLHLSGIFWATAFFAVIGMILLFIVVPTPKKLMVHETVESKPQRFKIILSNTQLLRCDLGIFCLHATLTALFIAIPILLTQRMGLAEYQQVILYLIILVVAFASMVPLIILSEKKRKMKPLFISAISTLVLTQILLLFSSHSVLGVGILLLIFFAAFTLLEASLPSLVSKISPIRNKGSAMGVYSTSQFFGIFVGGAVGGIVFAYFHLNGIFIFGVLLCLFWLSFAISMRHPPYLSTLIFKAPPYLNASSAKELSHKLRSIPGVSEVALELEEGLIYVKADKKIVDQHELRNVLGQGNLS